MSLFEAFLDIVYSTRCPLCRRLTDNELVCRTCAPLLSAVGENICLYCGKPSEATVNRCRECRGRRLYFDGARAAWVYEGAAREIIHDFKYGNQKSYARKLADYLPPTPAGADLITWVPLVKRKEWYRGYNQSKILAAALAAKTGIKAVGLLRRTRWTPDQNRLDVEARRSNAKNAFRLKPASRVFGKRVILVDDVYTTGATVAECARVLKSGNAASVNVLTLARTLLDAETYTKR